MSWIQTSACITGAHQGNLSSRRLCDHRASKGSRQKTLPVDMGSRRHDPDGGHNHSSEVPTGSRHVRCLFEETYDDRDLWGNRSHREGWRPAESQMQPLGACRYLVKHKRGWHGIQNIRGPSLQFRFMQTAGYKRSFRISSYGPTGKGPDWQGNCKSPESALVFQPSPSGRT